ncbi:Rieske 2Fe-2S domain-containing protein [Bradyrhizobium sp. WD16]|uniref:Rieske (2Fe-2S) protein n=1 Tax=Bradyrhizobium sp. WD16 TaxID=1521768 RepID=UPI0020A462F4|nr:Rieske 2Fe-2S domain-containing protein [Bradyrhizobium sp. WD16]UTD26183.1 (2Fe-2S)-binding protein [Bradyrhizobium sp. WD16]
MSEPSQDAAPGGAAHDVTVPDITAPDVYAICAASDIEKGAAKAFSLSRITEAGEHRPFAIFVVRTHANEVFGYVNVCPHEGKWLNFGDGEFFSRDRAFLRCGRHGALFEIDSGLCIAGDCKGQSLEPVAVTLIDGEVCLCGVPLVEDEGPDPFRDGDSDETMDIMIHPE